MGIPSDGKGMINIIAAVQKQQQQSGNHPITVHCRYRSPQPLEGEREKVMRWWGEAVVSGGKAVRNARQEHMAVKFDDQNRAR